jgi:peptide deformylase
MSPQVKSILQKEEKVLREVASEVPIEEISSPKIKKILKEMSLALASQDDGVAIAAPQIGYSLRIFLVAGKVFNKDFLENRKSGVKTKESDQPTKQPKDLVFINPVIKKMSSKKKWVPEGCLSVRWLYGKTHRSEKATVVAYDENANKFELGGSGLLAQIFQHETDHLNGILFIDHAKELKEETPLEPND